MRSTILLLLAAAQCLALSNQISITEKAGQTTVNYPIQVGRPFLTGEIRQYPQAGICTDANCTGVSLWLATQADVKSRWPDGSVKHAVLAFLIPTLNAQSTVYITFRNQANGNNTALTATQMLDSAYNFDATIALSPHNCPGCATQTASARAMLTAGAYSLWTQGQVAQTVVIADHSAAKAYDMGWEPDRQASPRTLTARLTDNFTPDTSHTLLVSDATGLTAPMTVRINNQYQGDTTDDNTSELVQICSIDTSVTPNQMEVCGITGLTYTPTTVTITTNGNHGMDVGRWVTVYGAQGVSGFTGLYRIIGIPSPNQLTLAVAGVSGNWSGGGWIGRRYGEIASLGAWQAGFYVYPDAWKLPSNPKFQSFRPIIHATFWPAIHKVKVRFIGEIADTEKIQDLIYDLALSVGASPSNQVYTQRNVIHFAGSRWTADRALEGAGASRGTEFWIGGAPGEVQIDHNLPYLIATRFVFSYDAAKKADAAEIAGFYSTWTSLSHQLYAPVPDSCCTIPQTAMSSPGTSFTGPYPEWMALYLFSFDNRMRDVALGSTDLAAAWQVHYREGSTNTAHYLTRSDSGCDSMCGADGFGHILSLTSRPTANPRNWQLSGTNVNNADKATIVGAFSNGSWTLGMNHFMNPWAVAYTITGDFWYLEEAWFWASYAAGYASPGYIGTTDPRGRGPKGNEGAFPGEVCLSNQFGYDGLTTGDASTWEIRTTGWIMRQRAETAFVSPDNTPEKSYFETLVKGAIAGQDGYHNVPPAFPSDPFYMSVWNWAKSYLNGYKDTNNKACGIPPLKIYSRGAPVFLQGLPDIYYAQQYGMDKDLLVRLITPTQLSIGDTCPADTSSWVAYVSPCTVGNNVYSWKQNQWPLFNVSGTAVGQAYIYLSGTGRITVEHKYGDGAITCSQAPDCGNIQFISNPNITDFPAGVTPIAHAFNGYTGTVNTNGLIVTWAGGDQFSYELSTAVPPNPFWKGRSITINGTAYAINTWNSATQLTLSSSAGVQSGVPYSVLMGTGGQFSYLYDKRTFGPKEGNAEFSQDILMMGMGRVYDLGYSYAKGIVNYLSGWYNSAATDPTFNPFLLAFGRVPTIRASDNTHYTTLADLLNGYDARSRGYSHINLNGSYYGTSTMALSFTARPEFPNGTKTWSWVDANFRPYVGVNALDGYGVHLLTYALVPRQFVTNVTVTAGSTQALVGYTAPNSSACSLALSADPDFGAPVLLSDTAGGLRRRIVAGFLTTGTTYYYRIDCDRGRATGYFQTSTGGTSTTVDMNLKPPPACGSGCTAKMEYGSNGTNWTAMALRQCSGGCRLSVPATLGQALYLRHTYYTDAGGAYLFSASPVYQVMPQ
jgi:hypothetical protein